MKQKDSRASAAIQNKMTDTLIDDISYGNKATCSKCASSHMHCNRHEARPKRDGLPPLPTPRMAPRNKAIEALKSDRSLNTLRKSLTRVGSCPELVQRSGHSTRSHRTSSSNHTLSDMSLNNSPPVSASKHSLPRTNTSNHSSPLCSPLIRRKQNQARDLNKSNSNAESSESVENGTPYHGEKMLNTERTKNSEPCPQIVSIERVSFGENSKTKAPSKQANGTPRSSLGKRTGSSRIPSIQTSRSGSCPNLTKRTIHKGSPAGRKQQQNDASADLEYGLEIPEGLSKLTFERCKEWLLGVEEAKESKTLSDATLVPTVIWDDE